MTDSNDPWRCPNCGTPNTSVVSVLVPSGGGKVRWWEVRLAYACCRTLLDTSPPEAAK
jgi:hypothetical protein